MEGWVRGWQGRGGTSAGWAGLGWAGWAGLGWAELPMPPGRMHWPLLPAACNCRRATTHPPAHPPTHSGRRSTRGCGTACSRWRSRCSAPPPTCARWAGTAAAGAAGWLGASGGRRVLRLLLARQAAPGSRSLRGPRTSTPRHQARQLALADFRREIAILKSCRDANVVQFIVRLAGGGLQLLAGAGVGAAAGLPCPALPCPALPCVRGTTACPACPACPASPACPACPALAMLAGAGESCAHLAPLPCPSPAPRTAPRRAPAWAPTRPCWSPRCGRAACVGGTCAGQDRPGPAGVSVQSRARRSPPPSLSHPSALAHSLVAHTLPAHIRPPRRRRRRRSTWRAAT